MFSKLQQLSYFDQHQVTSQVPHVSQIVALQFGCRGAEGSTPRVLQVCGSYEEFSVRRFCSGSRSDAALGFPNTRFSGASGFGCAASRGLGLFALQEAFCYENFELNVIRIPVNSTEAPW